MDITLFKEGLIVMVIGMGTVFVFLTIMIWAMNFSTIVLKFIGKYFPEEAVVQLNKKKEKNLNENEIALAIACAVHQLKFKGDSYGKS